MDPLRAAVYTLPACVLFMCLMFLFTDKWNNECKLKYGPEYTVSFQEFNIGCTVKSPVYKLR